MTADKIILVESQIINKEHHLFKELDHLCFLSKNLYNSALFTVRKHYRDTNSFLSSFTLISQFTKENQYDFRNLPAKVSRYTIHLVEQNYKSMFALLKLKANGSYDKPINLPKYLDKVNGRQVVHYHKQALSLKNPGKVKLSKTSIELPTKLRPEQIQYLKIIPLGNHIKIQIGYYKELPKLKPKKNKFASIDVGLNNLMTVTSTEFKPVIYNGRPLKSINQFYNKKKSLEQSRLMINNGKYWSNRLSKLTLWRENQMKNYFHKITRQLVDKLVEYDIDTVVIGRNKGWKDGINLSSKVNQNFVNIPFGLMYNMLTYKLRLAGINYVEIEESYTSKCSFIDKERICKQGVYLGKRVTRGLFRSGNGKYLNADVNGSMNILRKYLSNNNKYTEELHNLLLANSSNPLKIELVNN